MAIGDVVAGNKIIASELVAAFVSDPQTQVFTANGTWTKPSGAQYVEVEVVGGGGGGGGVTGAGAGVGSGGGGGSGGYVRKLFAASALSATEAVVIGAGGAGAASGGVTATAGGNTTFDVLTGGGGAGGGGVTSATTSQAGAAGAGGTATGGDVNIPGSTGDIGRTISGVAVFTGRGAGSQFGPQTPASTSSGTPGTTASGYGCGGSGSVADTTTRAGGAGSSGICIVKTYV